MKPGENLESSQSDDAYTVFPKMSSPTQERFSMEDVVPPRHLNRTLVLCFDGTGDQFDSDNSNVVNFFATLKKDDPSEQLVYYQSGIGTYSVPDTVSPLSARISKIVDSMVGIHLKTHVQSGYEFLMQNYEIGDKICIFGFSRGAYTARALAGMIHKVGLLPRCNHQQVPFAYRMYSREDELGWKQSAEFKRAFSIDVDIELLGVWDTVSSVGIIPRRLPFTVSNTHVRHFRHALALDERRVRFIPSFWDHHHEPKGLLRGAMPHSSSQHKPHRGLSKSERELHEKEQEYEEKTRSEMQDGYTETPTDIEEVWFAGGHGDVGGGNVLNEEHHALARIPLRWMIRQCFLLKTGILFHRELLKKTGIDPASLWPHVQERPPQITSIPSTLTEPANEEEEDIRDVLSPTFDQLKIARFWWILEFIPARLRYQTKDGNWKNSITLNRGRARYIPRQHHSGFKVHRTVKLRLEDKNLGYKPKTNWTVTPTWID